MQKRSLLLSIFGLALLGCADASPDGRLAAYPPPLHSASYDFEDDLDGESECYLTSTTEELILLDTSKLVEPEETPIEDFSQRASEVSVSIDAVTTECEFGPPIEMDCFPLSNVIGRDVSMAEFREITALTRSMLRMNRGIFKLQKISPEVVKVTRVRFEGRLGEESPYCEFEQDPFLVEKTSGGWQIKYETLLHWPQKRRQP